jgi:hypothetical protein
MAMSATLANAAAIAANVQTELINGNTNFPYLLQLLCAAINLAAQGAGSDAPAYTGPTFTALADNTAVSVRLQP